MGPIEGTDVVLVWKVQIQEKEIDPPLGKALESLVQVAGHLQDNSGLPQPVDGIPEVRRAQGLVLHQEDLYGPPVQLSLPWGRWMHIPSDAREIKERPAPPHVTKLTTDFWVR